MEFTVKQDKGKDSTVTVKETTIDGWPRDKRALVFTTDQSLQSASDRAWNVEQAIKEYAHPRGFDRDKRRDKKFSAIFIYDPEFHSRQAEFSIRSQIEDSTQYQGKKSKALQDRDKVNAKYGKAIKALKYVIKRLEDANRSELEEIKRELIETQVGIVKEIGIPDHVNEQHRKFLLEPHHPYTKIEMDHYEEYRFDLDEGLDWVLELI